MAGPVYVKNVCPTVAKRLLKYVFGDSLVSFNVNTQERTFEVEVTKDVPVEEIQYFIQVWGDKWKMYYYEPNESPQ